MVHVLLLQSHRTSFYVALGVLLAAGAVLLTADEAKADHFRGGSLELETTLKSVQANPTNPVVYEAKLDGWLAYSVVSADVLPGVGQLVNLGDRIEWGDGSTSPLAIAVTRVHTEDLWFEGTPVSLIGSKFSHTYLSPDNAGQPWTVQLTPQHRLDYRLPAPLGQPAPLDLHVHVNNPQTSSTLQVPARFPAPSFGSMPITVDISPLSKCRVGTICRIPYTALDSTGATATLRLATSAEALGGAAGTFYQPGPCAALGTMPGQPPTPAPWTNHVGCGTGSGVLTVAPDELIWDTRDMFLAGDAPTYYSAYLMATTQNGQTPVEILIQLAPVCTCPVGELVAPVLQTVSQFHEETADWPGHMVGWSLLAAPPGAMVSVTPPGGTAQVQIDWTPGTQHLGGTATVAVGFSYTTPERVLNTICLINLHAFALPPIAVPGALYAVKDTPLLADVMAHDPQGLPLSFMLLEPPLLGDLELDTDGSLRYDPPPGFIGPDSFMVRVDNGWTQPVDMVQTIVVQPDAAPVGVADVYHVHPTFVTEIAPGIGFTVNDISPGPIDWELVAVPELGSLAYDFGGREGLFYVPPPRGLLEPTTMLYRPVTYGVPGELTLVTFKPMTFTSASLPSGGSSSSVEVASAERAPEAPVRANAEQSGAGASAAAATPPQPYEPLVPPPVDACQLYACGLDEGQSRATQGTAEEAEQPPIALLAALAGVAVVAGLWATTATLMRRRE